MPYNSELGAEEHNGQDECTAVTERVIAGVGPHLPVVGVGGGSSGEGDDRDVVMTEAGETVGNANDRSRDTVMTDWSGGDALQRAGSPSPRTSSRGSGSEALGGDVAQAQPTLRPRGEGSVPAGTGGQVVTGAGDGGVDEGDCDFRVVGHRAVVPVRSPGVDADIVDHRGLGMHVPAPRVVLS